MARTRDLVGRRYRVPNLPPFTMDRTNRSPFGYNRSYSTWRMMQKSPTETTPSLSGQSQVGFSPTKPYLSGVVVPLSSASFSLTGALLAWMNLSAFSTSMEDA